MCITFQVTLVADTFEMSFQLKIISHLTSSSPHWDNVWVCTEAAYHIILLEVHIRLEEQRRNTITEYNINQEKLLEDKNKLLILLSENEGNSFREES